MGLKERRAIQEFEQNQYQNLKKELDNAAGFEVSVEVKWDTLAEEGYEHLYKDALPKVYFTPLINAIKKVAADDMGKNALKNGLKKVIISNEKGNSSPGGFSFSNGELVIDHKPCTNIDEIAARADALQKLIENAL